MKHIVLFLLCLISVAGYTQTTFEFDTYNTDDSSIEEVFDTNVLGTGVPFVIEVQGTWSIWHPSYWSSPCGLIETAPMFPSSAGPMTGYVSYDMGYSFSMPTSSLCAGYSPPQAASRIEISIDSGATWFYPTLLDPYNSAHKYHFDVVGEGYPIAVRQTSAWNSDDYGILKFSIAQAVSNDAQLDSGQSIMIYPNPSTDIVKVEAYGTGLRKAELTNAMGGKILETQCRGTSTILNVAELSSGVYFLTIHTDRSVHTERLVIK